MAGLVADSAVLPYPYSTVVMVGCPFVLSFA